MRHPRRPPRSGAGRSGPALRAEILGIGIPATLGPAVAVVVLLLGQGLVRAPLLPGLGALGLAAMGLLPAALELALPVGLLVSVVATGRRWALDGDLLAMAAAGLPARHLLPDLLAIGLLAGALQVGLGHELGPRGQAWAAEALRGGTLQLRPDQPIRLGRDGLLVRADGVDEAGVYTGLFVARGDLVAVAERGWISPGGLLELEQGEARRVGVDASSWIFRFGHLSLPMAPRPRRVELVERRSGALLSLIGRMERNGKDARHERLALYKRGTLPLALPLLGLLGLPLGARVRRPALTIVAVVLSWWALSRVGDQLVGSLGPGLAAGLPLGLLSLGTVLAWLSWKDR